MRWCHCWAPARKKKGKGKPLNVDDCIRVGLGQLCLSPSCFYDMLLSDFLLAAEGFYNLEETRQQAEWERTRWLACMGLAPHSRKGQRIKPQDLAIFPWEEKKKRGNNKLLANTLNRLSNGKT